MPLFGKQQSAEEACENAKAEVRSVREDLEQSADRVREERENAENGDGGDPEAAVDDVGREAGNGELDLRDLEAELTELAEGTEDELEARRAELAAETVHAARLSLNKVGRLAGSIRDDVRRNGGEDEDLELIEAEADDVAEELEEAEDALLDLAMADPAELEPDDVERLQEELADVREELDELRAAVDGEDADEAEAAGR